MILIKITPIECGFDGVISIEQAIGSRHLELCFFRISKKYVKKEEKELIGMFLIVYHKDIFLYFSSST